MKPVFPRSSILRFAATLTLCAAAGLPAQARADSITVFAAASLKDALDDIGDAFHDATGHDVVLSLAGSPALARQIQQGAPADIFISASTDWMDVLQADGLIAPETRFDLAGNTLVLIAHDADAEPVVITSGMDLSGMLADRRLAMALVDSVPAGVYGKAALTHLGQWDTVAPKVAQTDNVRAALALVATGEAPMGIVYATDAAAEDDVAVIGTFPADSHPPIIYPVAAVAASESALKADFLEFLRNPEARAALTRYGFALVAE